MEILIEQRDLKLLLEKRRDFISGWKITGLLSWGGTVLIYGLTSDFPDFGSDTGRIIRVALVISGAVLVALGTLTAIRNRGNALRYGHVDLLGEIMGLDTNSHKFSIVVIKDTYNEYPNRYLLRYVKDWDCDLFFSFPTREEGNEENIKDKLSHALHIKKDSIAVEFKNEDLTTKYSVRDKMTKKYDHKFYLATLTDFPPELRKETFSIDDVRYTWMTFPKMEENQRIREANLDIVRYVRDCVA